MTRSPRQRRRARGRVEQRPAPPPGDWPSFTVLLLGRTRRNLRGGIAQSAQMIVRALERVGDRCILRNVGAPLTDIPEGVDLIWHYGDADYLDQQLDAAAAAGIPVLVNSSFDGHPDRFDALIRQHDGWRDRAVAYGVFSYAAADVLREVGVRAQAVPKTIRRAGVTPPTFAERRGICLGDIEKLRRGRLVRGIDVEWVIEGLRTLLPDEPLWVYNQYGSKNDEAPAGVQVRDFQSPPEFARWLSHLRLFVVLARWETFAMVPAEASAVGTPVLFPPMPQSLDQHLGFAAVRCNDPVSLVAQAVRIYRDERFWKPLSDAGVQNGLASDVGVVGPQLGIALRLAARVAREPALPGEAAEPAVALLSGLPVEPAP